MARYCLIGPTYPFRGGIAHYTTLLALELRKEHDVLLISFKRQYPRWLFPGRDDRDPSRHPLRTEAEYLLDPMNPLSWHQTKSRVGQWQPDVVVIPWWVPYWAPTWYAIGRGTKRFSPRPRLLFICHNVIPHEPSILDKLALRVALAPGDGYITHSQSDAITLRHHFPGALIEVIPLPTFAALGEGEQRSPPVSFPAEQTVLIFFGFIRPYKGLDVLIDSLALVKQPLHLLIVGEFWEDELKYRNQIKQLRLEHKITLINEYVPNEQLTSYIAAADVAVLPYRSATQSAVVQVAFGLGRPVITTNVGGLPEVVEDGYTGLIVQPEDPEALAAAINHFIDLELGPIFQKNIEMRSDRFSWQHLQRALANLAFPPEE